ncbi:MAG: tetratricopeptide repeat protein [Desulfovibrio sp.]|jgi:Flp pilus assembly protein TadD|nr:tetratricopeptide repeat protein [Desulfovibrio sp.]
MSRPSSTLTTEQRHTLNVLGYLFLRMGQFERAKRVFSALSALDPDDMWARRNLAAIDVHDGDGASALRHLQASTGGEPLSSRDAALHLLRARALWLEGRKDEARRAVDAFTSLAGKGG